MKREDATIRAKRHVLAMKISSIFLPAIALTALVCGNAHASTDACQPIRNAIDQQNEAQQMQVSAAVTYIDSGRSYYYDTLYSGSKVYSRNRNGPWEVGTRRIVPVIVDGRPAIYDCRFVGTDHIGSATVMAYTYRRFIPDHTMDVRALIDAADGKFLQTEIVFGPFPDHRTKYTFSYGPNPPLPTVDERTLWHPPH
ncbi:hypothetical protein [Rhizobium sp. BK491]|uniref:hypothetical protein n=1 Tax=Rhizobium sp. BK491 TaxID=2587009 RepID=UPI00161B0A31|nr:hypothetical protein [Rhizobium sp. BK491]MBB3571970.1 hypothetical protein [Rhizobium sp. BK491]